MKKILLVTIIFCCFHTFNVTMKGQIAGQTPINPKSIPQFVDALPHFAGMRVDASGGNLTISYEKTDQVILSTGTVLAGGIVGTPVPPGNPKIGLAHLWAYKVSNGIVTAGPNWPSFTIEAQRGMPVNVIYQNNLIGETYSSVNLVADQTLHWADPMMDMSMSMDPYMGSIPVSPHLHGGEVSSESDGGPESWFTPNYAQTGPSWGMDGTDQNYLYPNTQEEATLWYHDHALGVTRLNVYAGLAGFYFLRGPQENNAKLPGWSGDDLVKEVAPVGKTGPFNTKAYLPEIEVVFQDRMLDITGGLYFPNIPTNPMVHPFWNPEFIGDIITVNGKTWPYLSVAPRKYRFRFLNGSNARFYEMSLQDLASGLAGPAFIQIGTDGGLLDAPVVIDPRLGAKLLLAPGERADIIIDFSKSAPGQTWTLKNTANAPYPKGGPPNGSTVGRLMQFIVNGKMISAADKVSAGVDKSLVPSNLRNTPLVKISNFAGATILPASVKRQLTLNEVMGMGGPLEVLVNNSKWDMNGMMTPGLGETELPVEGTTELWQIINTTADAHPIHLHLVQFQLVSRQKFNLNNYNKAYNLAFGGVYVPSVGPPLPYNILNADGALGGNPAITPYLQGPVKAANLNERGWKDTYIAYPGEITTFAIRYAPTDKPVNDLLSNLLFPFDPSLGPGYVWHCHIIDHEDNEMMRPFRVVASPFRTQKSTKENISSVIVPENKLINTDVKFALNQNFPNPFSGETEIRFQLPKTTHVKMVLYNQLGQTVSVLIDSEAPEGNNIVKLSGQGLEKGLYYYQLTAGSQVETKKMIVK